MPGAVVGLLWKSNLGEKRCLFSKEVKMLEIQKLSKLSIVRYTIAIIIDVSFSQSSHGYRSIKVIP